MRELAKPDLAPITRYLRAAYSSRLLIAAVHHLKVFERFDDGPQSLDSLQRSLDLKERPAMVLFPALCAMGLLEFDSLRRLSLTEQGRYLTSALTPNLIDYVGLLGDDPGAPEMACRLRNDGLPGEDVTYVKDGKKRSLMDDPETARYQTLALAGRARYLSSVVAEALPRCEGHFLDVAGGTGLFAYEWLLINPNSTATVLDLPHVLTVAAEFLDEFCSSDRKGASGVKKRVKLLAGNMMEDELPSANIILAANLFHDWPKDACGTLSMRFANALDPGGELWIYDAFLNDTMDGPLTVTDYSAQLFWFTKGRAYSFSEYYAWLSQAGLRPSGKTIATLMDYSLLSAHKSRD